MVIVANTTATVFILLSAGIASFFKIAVSLITAVLLQHLASSFGSIIFSEQGLPFVDANIGCRIEIRDEKNGDEGNRTLISAMRPRCAPVTPRPLNNYKPTT